MPVSIVMPAFNAAPYIAEAIQSVLKQTSPDWQLLIIDDSSTDDTATIARSFTDPRISVLHPSKKLGAAGARNLGTAHAKNDLLLYLDADDRLCPQAIETLEPYLRDHPEIGLVYANYRRIDAHGTPYGVRRFLNQLPRPQGDVLESFLIQNRMINGGVALVRKSCVLQVGGWNAALHSSNDWALWTLIAAITRFQYIPGFIALEYRELPTGISQSHNTSFERAQPAVDFVFTHPLMAARFSPKRLMRLRTKCEAHKLSLLASQNLRRRAYSKSLLYLGQALLKAPTNAHKTLAKYLLALADTLL